MEILDLGLPRLRATGAPGPETASRQTMGSVAYVAPAQFAESHL